MGSETIKEICALFYIIVLCVLQTFNGNVLHTKYMRQPS